MKNVTLRRKLTILLIAIYLPLTGFFLYYSRNVINRIDTQLVKGYRESLSAFCRIAQDEWLAADTYLTSLWNTIEKKDLNAPEAIASLSEQAERDAQTLLENNPEIGVIFLGTEEEKLMLVGRLYGQSKADFEDLADLLHQNKEKGWTNRGWSLYEREGSPLLVRTLSAKGISVMIAFDLRRLSESALTSYSLSSPIVFQNGGEYITSAHWLKGYEGEIESWDKENYYKIRSGDSTYVVVSSNLIGMNAVYGVPYTYDWKWLYYLLAALLSITLLFFAIFWGLLNNEVFSPLNKLVHTMEDIEEGNKDRRADIYKNMEFSSINNTFNRMVDRLENQRIETYEAQLNAKSFQMNALRLQIRRHFFLNCLKNIYSLTKTGNISDIQKTVLLLSKHLRFTLDISRDEIPLQEELESCRNYMKLVEIGQDLKPELVIRAEEEALKLPVPPISLLSLVENCNKYGQRQDQALRIEITSEVRKLDKDAFLWITVQDNGPGFTTEMLDKLNSEMNTVGSQGHVGINNVMDRIRVLYGEECSMTFSNLGGANVEIVIPLKGDGNNEAADS
ncbi:MAG: histidine kinase [Erysipelotrichaceae bacterium]|nr:histidine kinase [Erysipelotrichaceae bacterium]MBR3168071.1 histidine kinase [Erysipelotrichaceae bacterium]